MSGSEGAGAGAGAGANTRVNSHRKGLILEKFKRRMIRSVARRIKEKKANEDIWEELKKEIGSNCRRLWERMRMLTLKKLKRLLEAEDRVNLIGSVARMTLTDWLLFDLVIVHEKIDVIDRERLTGDYISKVLTNLFALVQRFEIEGRSGEDLAEAWTAATVYYNSKGHQCSPMMLQRRWYQIKELTRHKFYKFWFNYRGNQRQLMTAKMDSPNQMQKDIALKYSHVITEKFLSWEERIENRTVILPDELGIKMRQRNFMKPIDAIAPDVVLIEPPIETIDLGANSDTEDENEPQSEETQPPPVKVKSEPVDVNEEFEEQEFQIPPEKGSEFDEEIERLQMVEDNFDDGALKDNVQNSDAVVIDPVPTVGDSKEDSQSNEETEVIESGLADVDSFSIINENINNVDINEEAILIDDDDDEPSPQICASTLKVGNVEPDVLVNHNELVEKDSHVDEASDCYIEETVDESNGVIAEISSIASAGIKVENVDEVIERDRTNLDDEQITAYASDEMLPVISTITSAGIKVERNLIIPNDTIDNNVSIASVEDNIENVHQSHEITKALPVISTVSSEGVKVEISIEEIKDTEDSKMEEPNSFDIVNKPTDSSLVEKGDVTVNDLEEFDIPMDLNFADEGIDFGDDGIAYVEEDEDDIITIKDQPSSESETAGKEPEGKDEEEAQETEEEEFTDEKKPTEKTEGQKFDLKLLMYPVVYTTKLDAMNVFDEISRYEQVYGEESIDKIYTLSKPISKQSFTGSEKVMEEEEQYDARDINNEQVTTGSKNDTANDVSDDDLFRSEVIEESSNSDNESEAINDSKRVKLSSYMLQKPKRRSYNPVFLCKNPDFNTRLKKLSVGFFMSARNRTLLQSCMPMTIDMSKAFEEKLINGTLYLKPAPKYSSASINPQDNVEVISAALVEPSTVQQSLMNIDDTLENELKKCMAERIRAINLPDISQVRRLNQHLLTAEVTPLRSQNETSQVINKQSTRKIGPACYIQNIKDDINNLLSQQKAKEISDTDTNKDTVVRDKQPSPPPLVAVNNAVSITVQPTPPMVFINSRVPAVTPPPLSPLSNTSPSNSITNSDDTRIAPTSGATKVKRTCRRTIYPTLAWNKRHLSQSNQEPYQSDALLTIDTLYKMLSALDPSTKFTDVLIKKKNYIKKAQISNKNEEKPKENKTNDAVIDITDDEVPAKLPRPRPKSTVRTKYKDYCCWCSYRVDCVQGPIYVCDTVSKRRHKCKPGNCLCCCKDLYYLGDLASVPTAAGQAIERKEQEISQTIKHVVQRVNHPKPTTVADASIQIELKNDAPVAPESDITSSNNAVLTKTTSDTVEKYLNSSNDGAAELTPLQSKSKNPTPKFRVYTAAAKNAASRLITQSINKPNLNVALTDQSNVKKNDNVTTHTKDESEVIVRNMHFAASKDTDNNDVRPFIKTKTIKDRLLKSVNALPNPCTCRPNISKVNRGRIEINGKNNCLLHKKLIKESKIVLSKKLITNENQPFFVGKDKILLTNMRMPSKKSDKTLTASLVVPEKPAPILQPPEVQAISLPAGVQIALLPDQTLTYIIQPNVTLTSEECAILPEFLVAVQQQINAIGITLPVDEPVATTDNVIDLNEDESLNNPEVTVTNTESVTEVIETIEPPPKVGDESEDIEMEIDSLTNEETALEGEDFEMRIDFLARQKKNTEKLVSDAGDKSLVSGIEKPKNPESQTANKVDSIDNTAPVKDTSLKTYGPAPNNADEATNKKSLLSDLMEMSGIMEEDLKPAPHLVTPQPIILDTQNFVLHRAVPREEVVTEEKVIPVPQSLSAIPKTNCIATNMNKDGNLELAAVTSFAELKYSCDNNGIFFKLDLETGQLSAINVCIQKYPSKIQPNSKTVIDLTDDPDISITGSTDGNNSPTANQHSVEVTLNLPHKTQISTILQKKQRLMERLSNNLKPINILQSKKHVARILKRNRPLYQDPKFPFYTKRKLDNIEAKIDLVDSDTPVEEEYLESGDSSDDEPLIKKAKRKLTENTAGPSAEPDQAVDKQSEATPLNEQTLQQQEHSRKLKQLNFENNTNIQEPVPEQSNVERDTDEVQEQKETEPPVQEYSEEDDGEDSYEQDFNEEERYLDQEHEMDDLSHTSDIISPVPTNLVLSGGALNAHNIPLFRQDEEDSLEEDCILGV